MRSSYDSGPHEKTKVPIENTEEPNAFRKPQFPNTSSQKGMTCRRELGLGYRRRRSAFQIPKNGAVVVVGMRFQRHEHDRI